jgi:hypothetical protein
VLALYPESVSLVGPLLVGLVGLAVLLVNPNAAGSKPMDVGVAVGRSLLNTVDGGTLDDFRFIT